MAERQDRKILYNSKLPIAFWASKHVTLAGDPFFVFGRQCGQSAVTAEYGFRDLYGFKDLQVHIDLRSILITAFPPVPGMLCPIVVECDCGTTPCQGFPKGYTKGLHPEMDFPEIPFVHWSEVEVASSLPKTFCSDHAGG